MTPYSSFQLLTILSDIILSTLKPQLKNVTAHDVASSLYYLHLNTEDDLRLLEDDRASIPEEGSSRPSMDISRKPLPESARASLDIPRQVEDFSGNSGLYSTTLGKSPSQRSIPRRPLASRSPMPSSMPGRKPLPPLPGTENEAPRSSQDESFVPKASNETTRSSRSEPLGLNYNKLLERPPNSFSITIIRRDPTTGAQWNIGTVAGCPTTAGGRNEQGSPQRSKKPYFDMSVQLTAPGYTTFRNSHSANYFGGNSTNPSQNMAPNGESQQVPSVASSFDRAITMEGSKFWSSMQHRRDDSDMSTRSVASARDIDYGSSSTHNNHEGGRVSPDRSLTRGYIFTSPWGGRCKFSTGGGGRTLKCKHTLPSTTSSASDSMATPQASAAVSELRFNLPSSDVFASFTSNSKDSTSPKRFSFPKFGHIRSKSSSDTSGAAPSYASQSSSHSTLNPNDAEYRPPLPPRSKYSSYAADPSDDDYDDSRLDLSLGQEKAGGGNRGKRAKLGKLIIYDEGFKMLDLVVASNLGVWWSVWESDFK